MVAKAIAGTLLFVVGAALEADELGRTYPWQLGILIGGALILAGVVLVADAIALDRTGAKARWRL
jgi:hypothetical protein